METVTEKQHIVIEYENADDLRIKLKAEQRKLIGMRHFDVFRPVAIRNEEIIAINEQYFTADDFNASMFNPLRAIYVANGKHLVESNVHESLKSISLAVFGVKRNKDLEQKQLSQVQEAYQAFKELYLRLYEERITKEAKQDEVHAD